MRKVTINTETTLRGPVRATATIQLNPDRYDHDEPKYLVTGLKVTDAAEDITTDLEQWEVDDLEWLLFDEYTEDQEAAKWAIGNEWQETVRDYQNQSFTFQN